MLEIIPTVLMFSIIAAVTPGPLMALIIGETLKHGKTAGIKIGIAPLLTDLPIMLASVFILAKIQQLNFLLGAISISGGFYLVYLAYGSITTKEIHLDITSGTKSLMKGIIANFLNPNPYIFYFSVLSPLIIKGMKSNILFGPLSVSIFLGVFVLLNIILVFSVHAAKQFFTSKKYLYTIRILGIVLLFFAFTFFKDGLQFLGILK